MGLDCNIKHRQKAGGKKAEGKKKKAEGRSKKQDTGCSILDVRRKYFDKLSIKLDMKVKLPGLILFPVVVIRHSNFLSHATASLCNYLLRDCYRTEIDKLL